MKYSLILVMLIFLLISGCAAKEEPASIRPPRNLITQDNYEDLKIKPRKEEPVEVDYKKEGTYGQNFENVKIQKDKN